MISIKKYLKFLLIFIIIIFVIPALCTRKSVKVSTNIEEEHNKTEDEEVSSYDYLKYNKIRLFHSKTGEVEELPFDEYLYGVVSSEMPVDYEIEALKAQAIVSRTYTLYQIINGGNKHEGADICDDFACCQAWISKEDRFSKWEEEKREDNWNKIIKAVNETSGKIITYEGKPIDAFFHSNSGGITEVVSNVWGDRDLPYLQSVETNGESEYNQYSSEVIVSKEQLIEKLKETHKDINIDFSQNECIKIMELTESGRVKTIKFGNIEIAGTEARNIFGLKSTNFKANIEGDNIKFSVIGYGHGVGMSQTGADSMAKNGKACEDIIKHFYTGVEISLVNDLK